MIYGAHDAACDDGDDSVVVTLAPSRVVVNLDSQTALSCTSNLMCFLLNFSTFRSSCRKVVPTPPLQNRIIDHQSSPQDYFTSKHENIGTYMKYLYTYV